MGHEDQSDSIAKCTGSTTSLQSGICYGMINHAQKHWRKLGYFTIINQSMWRSIGAAGTKSRVGQNIGPYGPVVQCQDSVFLNGEYKHELNKTKIFFVRTPRLR